MSREGERRRGRVREEDEPDDRTGEDAREEAVKREQREPVPSSEQ